MIDAQKYVKFLAYYPHTAWEVKIMGWQDTMQFVYLVWLQLNKPKDEINKLNYEIIKGVRKELRRYSSRVSKENPFVNEKYYNINNCASSVKERFVCKIVKYYETHTAKDTIKFFDLPNKRSVYKALSKCHPKPERKSGKKYGEKREKVSTHKNFNQLLAEGVPRATAWRASKRGYYFRKEEK